MKEIYKTLKDTIENSQNILLILDENKPELHEVSETYTDTWDKMVQVEILKEYTANGKTIFTMDPDFEDVGYIQLPKEEPAETEEERYTESYHLEDVDRDIVAIYERIKSEMLRIDSTIRINPQKYYISLRKNRNFAFLKVMKRRIRITIMLPYEVADALIKKHKLTQLSASVQKFYNGPCFRVRVENDENLDEVLRALEEAYKQQS